MRVRVFKFRIYIICVNAWRNFSFIQHSFFGFFVYLTQCILICVTVVVGFEIGIKWAKPPYSGIKKREKRRISAVLRRFLSKMNPFCPASGGFYCTKFILVQKFILKFNFISSGLTVAPMLYLLTKIHVMALLIAAPAITSCQ